MDCVKLLKNDIGVAFTAVVMVDDNPANISSATSLSFLFQKPNGATATKSATFVTDGSDGQIRYISTSGFLDTIGKWSIQGYVVTPSGAWHTEIETFKVGRIIE